VAPVSIPKESREHESRSDWSTPKAVFDLINLKFGQFTLDPCASAENAKCETFFTKEQNGLVQSWKGHRVFCNPPYGAELPVWAEKAIGEKRIHGVPSVFLIPTRMGTGWFQDFCTVAFEVIFLRGRIPFVDPLGKRAQPMDDNCLVILESDEGPFDDPAFGFWDWKTELLDRLGQAAYETVFPKKRRKAA